MSHCFISYSTADGVELLQNLVRELEGGTPYIPAWYDTRNIPPGSNWDDEIVEAIKVCKCMLFVMSNDSTKSSSDCRKEILFALRYKKPIIPLLIHPTAEPVFMIATREWIDFTDFNIGLGKLNKYIQELNLPVGQLRLLKERLSDAEHDLRRATGEEADRIKAEIDDLNRQIETQKIIVDNPKKAEEQTQKNIEAGLERERQPVKPTAAQTSTKFINPPPGIAPNYFQDRQLETNEIVKFLQDDSQRLMTIVGRGGVGKTAMVCRLLKGLEGGELPDGLGRMRVEGIVYLSESGSHRVNFANLFYDLCKLLPSDAANELDAVYKNPQGSTESKMRALLEKFGSGRVVALLDNFEPLVDASRETFAIRDAELDEALRAFLNGTHTAVKVVITTRVAPRALNLIQPGRQRGLTLDEGLESPYAENILREMDSDGRLGLKSAGAEALNRARIKTRGFPRALEALFAILASDRYTTLEELLAMPLPENVVEALVGEAFNRLDTNAQKVMQALAVYNRPVTPAAVDYLLAPHIPAMDSAPILQRLANMHFARKESGRFYLHPVDREFAFGLIPQGETRDWRLEISDSDESQETDIQSPISNYQLPFTQHDLTLQAADYFAAARKPRAEWKKLEDLSAQLAEFDLRCAAGDYDTAASVLSEIDFNYLLLWGHYRLAIELHSQIREKINDKKLRMGNLNGLGLANYNIGKTQVSILFYETGLQLAREEKDLGWEFAFLGNIGNVYYYSLDDANMAIEYYEQALKISQDSGNISGKASSLSNLGLTYSALGEEHKAIEFYNQALIIFREIGDHRSEGSLLGYLGGANSNIGKFQEAVEFYEKAISIHHGIGDRRNEAAWLGNLGSIYADLGNENKAIDLYEQSLELRHEIGNRFGEAIGFENIGNAFLSLSEYRKAEEYFNQAINIADEITYPSEQLNARCGLVEVYLFQNDLVNARATIEAALQYDVPDNNHNASALHGIIALRQGDEVAARGAFVRAIGQADEILSKTAEYYSALDAKGLALSGLAVVGGQLTAEPSTVNSQPPTDYRQQAIEAFKQARKIAPHAGVVKSVLRLFDELAKCEGGEMLKDIRPAAEGKPTN